MNTLHTYKPAIQIRKMNVNVFAAILFAIISALLKILALLCWKWRPRYCQAWYHRWFFSLQLVSSENELNILLDCGGEGKEGLALKIIVTTHSHPSQLYRIKVDSDSWKVTRYVIMHESETSNRHHIGSDFKGTEEHSTPQTLL